MKTTNPINIPVRCTVCPWRNVRRKSGSIHAGCPSCGSPVKRRYTHSKNPEIRETQLLAAAVEVARKPGGWLTLTRYRISQQAKCSEALISIYLGDMKQVKRRIMDEAVHGKIYAIIAQSLAAHDGYADRLPPAVRSTALRSLLG